MDVSKKIDELIHTLDPEALGRELPRAESDKEKNRLIYRKGAKSALELFTDDYDFIEKILLVFDKVYEGEENEIR